MTLKLHHPLEDDERHRRVFDSDCNKTQEYLSAQSLRKACYEHVVKMSSCGFARSVSLFRKTPRFSRRYMITSSRATESFLSKCCGNNNGSTPSPHNRLSHNPPKPHPLAPPHPLHPHRTPPSRPHPPPRLPQPPRPNPLLQTPNPHSQNPNCQSHLSPKARYIQPLNLLYKGIP